MECRSAFWKFVFWKFPFGEPSGCTRTAPSSGNWDAQDGPGVLSNQIWCILRVHQKGTFRTNTNPIRIFGSGKPPSLFCWKLFTQTHFLGKSNDKSFIWVKKLSTIICSGHKYLYICRKTWLIILQGSKPSYTKKRTLVCNTYTGEAVTALSFVAK